MKLPLKILKIYPDEIHISPYNIAIYIRDKVYIIEHFDSKLNKWIQIKTKRILTTLKKLNVPYNHRKKLLKEIRLMN